MKLRYIGDDRLYGLTTYQVYEIELFTKNGFIWVKVDSRLSAIPYMTPIAFANNWEAVR